ncbi:MAG: hypothetical protein ACXVPK_07945 [Tumebacillaceae bacterium]
MDQHLASDFKDRYDDLVESIGVFSRSALRKNRFTAAQAVAFTMNELGEEIYEVPSLALVAYVHLLRILDDSEESNRVRKIMLDDFSNYLGKRNVSLFHVKENVVFSLIAYGNEQVAESFEILYQDTMESDEHLFWGQLMAAN